MSALRRYDPATMRPILIPEALLAEADEAWAAQLRATADGGGWDRLDHAARFLRAAALDAIRALGERP